MSEKQEYFEMRFHSIGGQGAYTVGKLLAEIILKDETMNSSLFATYGSEKKGAPVSVFLRMLQNGKITKYSAVRHPNMVVVFHEKLLETTDVLEGLKDDGILLINTDLSPQEVTDLYGLDISKIAVVDATKIALENKTKANTVMFGAIIKVLDKGLGIKDGTGQIEEYFKYKYEHLIKANQESLKQGYEEAIVGDVTPSKNKMKFNKEDLGYENQYFGGIIKGNNAQNVNRSISREGYVPKFDKSKCINCTKCDMACPDDCFIWKEEEGRRGRIEMNLQGINFKHCKGCLKCVNVCPTDALKKEIETRNFAK